MQNGGGGSKGGGGCQMVGGMDNFLTFGDRFFLETINIFDIVSKFLRQKFAKSKNFRLRRASVFKQYQAFLKYFIFKYFSSILSFIFSMKSSMFIKYMKYMEYFNVINTANSTFIVQKYCPQKFANHTKNSCKKTLLGEIGNFLLRGKGMKV